MPADRRGLLVAAALLAAWLAAAACAALLGGAYLLTARAGACAQAPTGAAAADGADAPARAAATDGADATGVADAIPRRLLPLYRGAAARYGLGAGGWAWLASINYQETRFGRDLSTSSAGAVGWMQFLPSTWARYGVDANGDRSADPADPADAIYAAARYLRTLGAPSAWHRAVFAYGGGAEWYYAQVAARARGYAATGGGAPDPGACAAEAPDGGGYTAPLPHGVAYANARTDMGVDLETGPAGIGRELLAIGDAQVLAIKPMGAFGPTWISYRLLGGPLRGRVVFVGHSGPPLVAVGQRVAAGAPLIAIHGGSYGGPPGHLEIGWALADGSAPAAASHYAEGQVTAEGRSFRRLLARLGMTVCGPEQRAQGWC